MKKLLLSSVVAITVLFGVAAEAGPVSEQIRFGTLSEEAPRMLLAFDTLSSEEDAPAWVAPVAREEAVVDAENPNWPCGPDVPVKCNLTCEADGTAGATTASAVGNDALEAEYAVIEAKHKAVMYQANTALEKSRAALGESLQSVCAQ